jgi:hypothetical protein
MRRDLTIYAVHWLHRISRSLYDLAERMHTGIRPGRPGED